MKIKIENIHFGDQSRITVEPGRAWRIVHAISRLCARLFGR